MACEPNDISGDVSQTRIRSILKHRTTVFCVSSQRRLPSIPPISQLPTELIIWIFSSLIDLELKGDGSFKCPTPGWMVVLGVCKRWRAIAEGSPQLWSRISTANTDLVGLFISRSQTQPLELQLRGRAINSALGRIELPWPALARNAHRVRCLDLEVEDLNQFLHIVEKLSHNGSMPQLEMLVLENPTCLWFSKELMLMTTPAALERCMPSLRILRIMNGFTVKSFSSRIFCNLTVLELHKTRVQWAIEGMTEFVSCMREWTRLEELVLEDSLPIDHAEYPVPDPQFTISLPRLRHIRLMDLSTTTDYFIRHLVLAPTTSLHMHLASITWDMDLVFTDPTEILRSLFSSVSTSITKSIRALYISDDTRLIVRGSDSADFGDLDKMDEPSLLLEVADSRVTACDFLGCSSSNDTFDNVEVLHIDSTNMVEWDQWMSTLPLVNNVKKAVLSEGRGSCAFITPLGQLQPPESVHVGQPFLPHLEELSVTLPTNVAYFVGHTLWYQLAARREYEDIPVCKLRLLVKDEAVGDTVEQIVELLSSVVKEVIVIVVKTTSVRISGSLFDTINEWTPEQLDRLDDFPQPHVNFYDMT